MAVPNRILMAVASLVLSACLAGEPANGPECGDAYDKKCREGQVCVDFHCYAVCQKGEQCGPADACIDGYCQPYAQACLEHGECAHGWYCDGGACHKEASLGAGCTVDAACGSGFCVAGVCCDATCDGTCQSCVAAETGEPNGGCAAVLVGRDPNADCPGLLTCDGTGGCFATQLGAGCSDGPSQCLSGFCAPDGVCCESACDGICERCSTAGVCEAVPDGEDPDLECADDQGYGCDGDRACHSGAAVGVACGMDVQCASDHCVDSVCCESACAGQCQACSRALTGLASGQCEPISFFTDPDGECSAGVGCNGDGVFPACNLPKSWASPS